MEYRLFNFPHVMLGLFQLKRNSLYSFAKKVLLLLSIITLFYFAYTALLNVVFDHSFSILNSLFGVSSAGSSLHYANSGGNPLSTALFGYAPLCVPIVLGFIGWLDCNSRIKDNNRAIIETSFLFTG